MSYFSSAFHESIFCPRNQDNTPIFFDPPSWEDSRELYEEIDTSKKIPKAIIDEVAFHMEQLTTAMNDLEINYSGKRTIHKVKKVDIDFDELLELEYLFEQEVFLERPFLQEQLKSYQKLHSIFTPKYTDFAKTCITKCVRNSPQIESLWETAASELYNFHLRQQAYVFIEHGLKFHPNSLALHNLALKILIDVGTPQEVALYLEHNSNKIVISEAVEIFKKKVKYFILVNKPNEATEYFEILADRFSTEAIFEFGYVFYQEMRQRHKALEFLEKKALVCPTSKSTNTIINYFLGCQKIGRTPKDNLIDRFTWRATYLNARRYERMGIYRSALSLYDRVINTVNDSRHDPIPQGFQVKAYIAKKSLELLVQQKTNTFAIEQEVVDSYKVKNYVLAKIYALAAKAYATYKDYAGAEILIKKGLQQEASWLLWDQAIDMRLAQNDLEGAKAICEQALSDKSFSNIVRLIVRKMYLNLSIDTESSQYSYLLNAVNQYSNSGNLYCEIARFHLNPLSKYYDLEKAEEFLELAVSYTPKYSDIYIEILRLTLLKHGFDVDIRTFIHKVAFAVDKSSYGTLWFSLNVPPSASSVEKLEAAKELIIQELSQTLHLYKARAPAIATQFILPKETIDLSANNATFIRLMFALPNKQLIDMTDKERTTYFNKLFQFELDSPHWCQNN